VKKIWTSDGVVVTDDGLVEVNACLAKDLLKVTELEEIPLDLVPEEASELKLK